MSGGTMRISPLCISLILATAAEAAEPEPCTPPRPGAWVEMALANAPQLTDTAEVRKGFFGRSKWWLWDALEPLTQSRVFDVRCNAWRRTTVAEGTRLPRQLDRRYGVLFGDNELAVYAPTWETATADTLKAVSTAVFVLDGERLQWTDVTAARPPISHDARVFQGDGLLVFWDERGGSGAIFTLATKHWVSFTERPPLVGQGYDCSWIQGGTWLVANPTGVFRFDVGSKKWSPVLKPEKPMLTQELGACLLSSSRSRLAVAVPKSLYAPRRTLFAIEGAGTAVWEIPWAQVDGEPNITAVGNTVWHKDSAGTDPLRRYDRGTKKWVRVASPKGLDARATFLSELQGQPMLVELPQGHWAPAIRTQGMAPPPKPAPTRVSLWNGKSFGRPITIGLVEAFRGEVQASLGGLAALDKGTVRVLDASGRERQRFAEPPKWLAWSGFGPEAFVTWGVTETAVGNDCDNPFHPREPDEPTCDPTGEVVYRRFEPGGFVLLRAPGGKSVEK
jgi:hypothetical protein